LRRGLVALLLAVGLVAGCGSGEGSGEPVRFTVPRGAGVSSVADTLAAREVIGSAAAFKAYARTRGGVAVRPGIYEVRPGASFAHILDRLAAGDVVRTRVVIPEGWDLRGIAPAWRRPPASPPTPCSPS
jgi:UPF0755 protein